VRGHRHEQRRHPAQRPNNTPLGAVFWGNILGFTPVRTSDSVPRISGCLQRIHVQHDLSHDVAFFGPMVRLGHIFQWKNLGPERKRPRTDRRIQRFKGVMRHRTIKR
jgi:hypothetical protein